MARLFTAASSQSLVSTLSASVTAPPLTMACWYKPTTSAAIQTLMSVTDLAVATNGHAMILLATGKIAAQSFDGGVNFFASSGTTAVTNGTYGHCAVTMTGLNDRRAYLNGVVDTPDTNVSAASALVRTAIGQGAGSNFPNGAIAEAAIWKVALTAAEVASLATGICPLLIRPGSLVSYWPLYGLDSPEHDLMVGGRNLTLSNAPTQSTHPRIMTLLSGTMGRIGSGPFVPPMIPIALPLPVQQWQLQRFDLKPRIEERR